MNFIETWRSACDAYDAHLVQKHRRLMKLDVFSNANLLREYRRLENMKYESLLTPDFMKLLWKSIAIESVLEERGIKAYNPGFKLIEEIR